MLKETDYLNLYAKALAEAATRRGYTAVEVHSVIKSLWKLSWIAMKNKIHIQEEKNQNIKT